MSILFVPAFVFVAVIAVALELYLMNNETDRTVPINLASTTIDNNFYSNIDWWSDDSVMRGKQTRK